MTKSATRRNERVRCAMYARKSSEEGLEQAFNSLQAQREACEAFIILVPGVSQPPMKVRFAPDSTLEGTGFEILVPLGSRLSSWWRFETEAEAP
jgi:hypothetical protein